MKHFFIVSFAFLIATLGVHAQAPMNVHGNTTQLLRPTAGASNLRVSDMHWKRKRIQKDYYGTITLENTGSTPITIQSADWGQGSDPIAFTTVGDLTFFKNLTIEPGKIVQLDVHFNPATLGPKSATIQFTTTTGDVVVSSLDGTGIVGRLVTTDLDFGTTELKTQEYSKRRFMIQCRNWEFEDSVTILDISVISGTVSEDIKSPFSSDGFRYNKGEITFPITIHPGQTLIFLDSVEFQAQVHGSSIARLQTVSDAEAEVISVWTGKGASTSVENDHLTMSECSFTLGSNPITREGGIIEFTIPTLSAAELSIYSLSGEKMLTLVNSIMDSGSHQVSIPVERLSAGVYGVRMVVGNCVKQKAMVLVQ